MKKLNEKGILTIAAAGNFGPKDSSILSPAISKDAVAVGYVNNNYSYEFNDDKIAYQSSRDNNPDIATKPDILTLGIDILSLDVNNNYAIDSGSSYSTAIVSGVSAVLIEKYETSENIKDLLLLNTINLSGENLNSIKQLYLK